MRTRRVPVSVIVLVMGAVLIACCAAWAVLVQVAVPDICTYPPSVTNDAGPIRCEE